MKEQRVVLSAAAGSRNLPSASSCVFRAAAFNFVTQNVGGAGLLRTIKDLKTRREY
jgi:hypothetical protein